MKDHWEKLGTDAHALKERIEELLENAPQSARFYKLTTDLNKAWTKFQKSMNDMDQFIAPVKSVEVKCAMLTDATFSGAWAMWKDYLNEQHGITMRSRAELAALKRLVEIADNNPATAAGYLEYAMSRVEKNFYKVTKLELPPSVASAATATTGKSIIKLPSRYSASANQPEDNSPPESGGVPEGGGGILHQKTIHQEIAEFKKSKKNKTF